MHHKVTVPDILNKKKNNEKIACLTAYDAPTADILDGTGIDIILVGDSLGNVILGFDGTRQVTIEDMVRHTMAVRSRTKHALLAADLSYDSFSKSDDLVHDNALRLRNESGAEAVKIEGAGHLSAIKKIVTSGIPVIGHLGHLPQDGLAPRLYGRDPAEAEALTADALALQDEGVFAVVLELIDPVVAGRLTSRLRIPTIGIGSGPECDGQILVTHDMVGLYPGKTPKFVKQFADVGALFRQAVSDYISEVRSGKYPS